MRIENILIGLAVFFGVISLAVGMYANVSTNYNFESDDTLFANLTKNDYSEYSTDIDELRDNSLKEDEGSLKDVDNEVTLYIKALNLIRRIGSIITTPINLIENIALKLPIPNFIARMVGDIIIILGIAFIIYMFVRFKPQ